MNILLKISSAKKSSVFIVALILAPFTAMVVQALPESESRLITQRVVTETTKIQGDKPPSIIQAGLLNSVQDHFFDVLVSGEPLNRLEVKCVTFHELDEVKVIDPATDKEIPHGINFGFEEFTVTFDEPIPVGSEVRIVMEGTTIRGVTSGIIVPYRIFGVSDALGTIPLGTALVRGASSSN